MTLFQYLDNLQNKNTNCNTVSWGNLLSLLRQSADTANTVVTVFAAPNLDWILKA